MERIQRHAFSSVTILHLTSIQSKNGFTPNTQENSSPKPPEVSFHSCTLAFRNLQSAPTRPCSWAAISTNTEIYCLFASMKNRFLSLKNSASCVIFTCFPWTSSLSSSTRSPLRVWIRWSLQVLWGGERISKPRRWRVFWKAFFPIIKHWFYDYFML